MSQPFEASDNQITTRIFFRDVSATASAAPVPGRSVRGAVIRTFVLWYEVELGTSRFRALLARLPSDIAAELELAAEGLGIDAHAWYSDVLVGTLLEALTGHLSEIRRGHVALRAARVVMRSVLASEPAGPPAWMRTPESYALHAQQLWSRYYDSGTLRVVPRSDPQGALCLVRDFRGHHPLLCELNAGAATAIYESMGKRSVMTTRLSCLSHGHPECRFSTLWRS